nr:glutamine--fructose-6-phosphate aminotransferase [isomerizing] 2 [Tanacetum cinerariifolium]
MQTTDAFNSLSYGFSSYSLTRKRVRGVLNRLGESNLEGIIGKMSTVFRGSAETHEPRLLVGLKYHLQTIRSGQIILVGCGTSYNAALAQRPMMEELSVR